MKRAAGISACARELLLALRGGPLDVDELAAELTAIRIVVAAKLEGLIEASLVHAVTVSWSGRQAWGLTVGGRSRVATGGEL